VYEGVRGFLKIRSGSSLMKYAERFGYSRVKAFDVASRFSAPIYSIVADSPLTECPKPLT